MEEKTVYDRVHEALDKIICKLMMTTPDRLDNQLHHSLIRSLDEADKVATKLQRANRVRTRPESVDG